MPYNGSSTTTPNKILNFNGVLQEWYMKRAIIQQKRHYWASHTNVWAMYFVVDKDDPFGRSR